MTTLKLDTQIIGNRTKVTLYLSGFHTSQLAQGDIFLNKEEAEQYCKDKVIYVRPVTFYSEQEAINFINTEIKSHINMVKDFGISNYFEKALGEIPCPTILDYINRNKNLFI